MSDDGAEVALDPIAAVTDAGVVVAMLFDGAPMLEMTASGRRQ